MALRVSTVTADVIIRDLGITVVHPTTDRDLSLEFSALELKTSEDLTAAIQNGDLTADDGTYTIYAVDYDPDEVLIQQLGFRGDDKYISYDELRSNGDVPVVSGTFPLALNSTSSITRNVYVPGGKWITWEISPRDKVEITGCAASGIYIIESISDQQNFIVEDAIPTSTGGSISIYHPNAAAFIGTDDTNFSLISGVNLQAVLESIDDQLGSGGFSDELIKISSNDTTAGYLIDKIIRSAFIMKRQFLILLFC